MDAINRIIFVWLHYYRTSLGLAKEGKAKVKKGDEAGMQPAHVSPYQRHLLNTCARVS